MSRNYERIKDTKFLAIEEILILFLKPQLLILFF
jgi:hypothetical protein